MEIEIESRKENKLLDRTEIKFRLTHEGETPSRKRVKDKIAEKIGGKSKIIILEWLKSSYGISETLGYAKVYNSKENAEKIEAKHVLKRNFGSKKTEAKPEEKPETGAKPEEKPETEAKPEEGTK